MIRAEAALLACLACTVTPHTPAPGAREARAGGTLNGAHLPLDPATASLAPEAQTIEQSWLLDLYTWLHSKDYTSERVVFPGTAREEVTAHLLLPAGEGPHAAVVVFPILAGSHVVSEALAKALVSRGYAVARLERPEIDLADPAVGPADFAAALRSAVLDARRLIDLVASHPRVDGGRLASAGVSLGGLQALLLAATDPRVRGGFFVMVGGGLAELLWDSTERPVRAFRERLRAERGLADRAAFVAALRDETRDVDPLTYAWLLDPESVLLASGRFDRVMPPARTEELWRALGRPRWLQLPVGHYQLFPFFWWTVGRGADHLDRLLAVPSPADSYSSPEVPKGQPGGDGDE
ncbi:MAG: acetylxylan esterase [Myxococcota bacterium]